MSKRRDPERWSARTRNFVLFVGGFLGVLYETIVERVDRPVLLAVFGGMLGLPGFLARDSKDSGGRDGQDGPRHKSDGGDR